MDPQLQTALVTLLAVASPIVALALTVMNSRQQEATRAQQETTRAQKIINDEFVKEREARQRLETERDIQAQELVRLNGLIVLNGKQIADVNAALENVSSERDGLKAKLEATGRELETTKTTLNARLSEVMTSLEKLNVDYAEMQGKYKTMEIEREQIEKELKERAAVLELENTQHRNRITELEKELEIVRTQLTSTEDERDTVRAQLQAIETEKLALEEQMKERDILIAQLRIELDALRVRADAGDVTDAGIAADVARLEPPTDTDLPLESE